VARWWAGIDWSEHGHDVAVIDADGTVVVQTQIAETFEGVGEMLRLLSRLSRSYSRRRVPVAIETSRGLLVAALRAAGQEVVAIDPTVVARYRGRLTPASRKKSDRSDAVLLAHILRTDRRLHRPLWRPPGMPGGPCMLGVPTRVVPSTSSPNSVRSVYLASLLASARVTDFVSTQSPLAPVWVLFCQSPATMYFLGFCVPSVVINLAP